MLPSAKMYSAVLRLVHILYTFIEFLIGVWVYVVRKIRNYHEIELRDFKSIHEKIKGLNKVPQHLAVILGPEKPSFKDLVNLVVWCIASGIPYISFYDHNGLLKKSEEEFFRTISDSSDLVFENGFWMKKEAPFNGYKSGFTRKIHISVFSLHDGKHSIVETTRSVIKSRSVHSSSLSIDYLDKCLNERFGSIPDPDLAVYCTEICSTFGFLPWQIRVTEFVNLQTHHNVSVDKFISILQFYGLCEQRLGK